MNVPRYTSRTMQYRRRLIEMLSGASWPDDAGPVVGMPARPDGVPMEFVFVDRVLGDSSEVHELGPFGRTERLTATIVLDTCVPGLDEAAAADRAEALADVVQQLFYDDSGPLPGPAAIGVDGEFVSAQVVRTELQLYPAPEGFGVRYEIDVQTETDI